MHGECCTHVVVPCISSIVVLEPSDHVYSCFEVCCFQIVRDNSCQLSHHSLSLLPRSSQRSKTKDLGRPTRCTCTDILEGKQFLPAGTTIYLRVWPLSIHTLIMSLDYYYSIAIVFTMRRSAQDVSFNVDQAYTFPEKRKKGHQREAVAESKPTGLQE